MPPRQGVHFFAASVSVMSWPSDDSLGVEGDGGLCQSYRMPALQFHCPHCGALYEKTDTKSIAQDLDRVVPSFVGTPCMKPAARACRFQTDQAARERYAIGPTRRRQAGFVNFDSSMPLPVPLSADVAKPQG